ncbi:MAG: hypothetical protein JW927_15285 [Deltaproteobacteria bacterium]|nr:hypothetical protein [Deltaproteobacteria bacterium]
MKRIQKWAIVAVAVIFITIGLSASYTSAETECTRDGLKAITTQFLTSLETHNPSAAPLASNARYTENGIDVATGKGTWETAGKVIFKRTMVDTKKCGIHTQTIIEENGKQVLYGVRLKVEKEKISEIEAIVVRGKEVLNPKAILDTAYQDWEEPLPPQQRSSRLAMIAVADDYFELFVKDKKRVVSDLAYSGFCDRWENGTITTKGGMNQNVIMPKHDCSPEGFADMTETHGKRRFLVDEEAGVVVAYMLFNNSWPDFHMFKINNGLVVWIQAYFEYSKTYKTMGWPDEPACE